AGPARAIRRRPKAQGAGPGRRRPAVEGAKDQGGPPLRASVSGCQEGDLTAPDAAASSIGHAPVWQAPDGDASEQGTDGPREGPSDWPRAWPKDRAPDQTISQVGRRGSPRPAYAALDLGTNNCRLLVARPSRRGFRVIDAFSRIIRLGEGVSATGRLSESAVERTLDALKVCAAKIRR